MSLLSLSTIARSLSGYVRGTKVVAPGPEAASKRGHKRRKRTLTVWVNADGDIGVNSWRGQDAIATKDWVRRQCGFPAWQPKPRTPKTLPALWERNQFLSESLRIARCRKRITAEQFALIINDLKNARAAVDLNALAARYGRDFGIAADAIKTAMLSPWRSYTADQRAQIWNISLAERLHLDLRRTGSIDADKQARERARRDRYNAKRRALRTTARAAVAPVASIRLPRFEEEASVAARTVNRGHSTTFSPFPIFATRGYGRFPITRRPSSPPPTTTREGRTPDAARCLSAPAVLRAASSLQTLPLKQPIAVTPSSEKDPHRFPARPKRPSSPPEPVAAVIPARRSFPCNAFEPAAFSRLDAIQHEHLRTYQVAMSL